MEWVNITAKTLPEAIDLALDNLGVDEAEAEIEVLEEPRQGLFGRVRGNARVRARVKPKATRPKIERGRNRKRRNDGGRDGGSGGRRSRGGNKPSSRGRGQDDSESGARSGRDGGAESTDDQTGEKTAGKEAVGRGDDRSDGGRGAEGRDGSRGRKRSRGRGDRKSQNGGGNEPVEEASMDEVSEQLEVFLGGLTEAFGFEGGVTVTEDDGGLVASVDGRHGLMVGPKGRTLDAIQELARVTAQRSAPSNIRIKVDVGGYRELRREALVKFALEAAEEARSDGKERSLEPMNAADRKVVHDALSDVADVETRSAGTDPRRRVVVVPLGATTGDGADDEPDQSAESAEEVTNSDGVDDGDRTEESAAQDAEAPGDDDSADGSDAVDESESVGSQQS